MTEIVYHQNDNLLEVDLLKNVDTAAYINNATVTATLKDASGNNVVGETWPLTMSYVAASNGKYRAKLKDTLTLIPGRGYVAEITADGGADLRAFWELPVKVERRVT